mgnify:FL=1
MSMTLETLRAIIEIFFLLVAVPITGFKIWRKLDARLSAQDAKLGRIEYALFNEGRGMEQQLKEVHKNQQSVIIDLAVLKAKAA